MLFLGVAFASRSALADPSASDRTLARSLFEQARKAMDARDYAVACPRFAESQRLDPSAGTLLNLAVCHERAGKLATAWAEFGDAATAARHAGEPERAAFADEHENALEPRLAHITIRVTREPGLTIQLDEATIGPAAWGTPLPADIGAHRIVALREGQKAWETTRSVPADGASVSVDVPASAAATPVTSEPQSNSHTKLGWIAVGVGGAGLAVGSIFGALALNDKSTLDGQCGPSRAGCPSSADIGGYHAHEWIADIGFGIGVVGIAVGAVLVFTSAQANDVNTASLRFEPGPSAVTVRF